MTAAQGWGSTSEPGASAGSTPHVVDDRLDLPEHTNTAAEPGEPPSLGGRYTLRRFVRECCIALAIFLLGLPLALFLPAWLGSSSESGRTAVSGSPTTLVVSGGGLDQRVTDPLAADGRVRFVTHHGNGFAAGPDPLARSAPATAARTPFLDVVVQGGEVDVSQPPRTVEVGALHMIDRLRAQMDPGSSITIIGPIPEAEMSSDLLRVRDELAAATTEKGVRFIDPIEHGLRQGQPDLQQQLETLLFGDAP